MPRRPVLPPSLWDVRHPLRFELPQALGRFQDSEFFESELLSQRHLRRLNFHVQGVVVEVAVLTALRAAPVQTENEFVVILLSILLSCSIPSSSPRTYVVAACRDHRKPRRSTVKIIPNPKLLTSDLEPYTLELV